VSQRPRRGYAAGLRCGPPARDENNAHPEVPTASLSAGRAAPGPHPPGSSRWRLVKDVITPVPRTGLPLVKVKLRPAALTARPWP
jgi:hypothetical protein